MSTTTQRPTPETDAVAYRLMTNAINHNQSREAIVFEFADFAKRLERERDEARTQADNFAKQLEAMREAIRAAYEVLDEADGSSYHIQGDACLTKSAKKKRDDALAKLQPFLKP